MGAAPCSSRRDIIPGADFDLVVNTIAYSVKKENLVVHSNFFKEELKNNPTANFLKSVVEVEDTDCIEDLLSYISDVRPAIKTTNIPALLTLLAEWEIHDLTTKLLPHIKSNLTSENIFDVANVILENDFQDAELSKAMMEYMEKTGFKDLKGHNMVEFVKKLSPRGLDKLVEVLENVTTPDNEFKMMLKELKDLAAVAAHKHGNKAMEHKVTTLDERFEKIESSTIELQETMKGLVNAKTEITNSLKENDERHKTVTEKLDRMENALAEIAEYVKSKSGKGSPSVKFAARPEEDAVAEKSGKPLKFKAESTIVEKSGKKGEDVKPLYTFFYGNCGNILYLMDVNSKTAEKVAFDYNHPYYGSSIIVDEKFFIIGGSDGASGNLATTFALNLKKPIIPNVVKKADLNMGRHALGLCAVQNAFIYGIGGRYFHSGLSSESTGCCEKYDIANNIWKKLPALNEARHLASVCELDNFLYAIGGHIRNAEVNVCSKTIEVFNMKNEAKGWEKVNVNNPDNSWVPVQACGVAKVADGVILIFGGDDGSAGQAKTFLLTKTENGCSIRNAKCEMLNGGGCFYYQNATISTGSMIYATPYSNSNIHVYDIKAAAWGVIEAAEWVPK